MSIPLFSHPYQPADEALIEQARRFAQDDIEPNAEQWERQQQQPNAILRAAAAQFAGLRVPREMGGLGASHSTVACVYHEFAKADLAFTFGLVVHGNLARAIAVGENDTLCERYLSKMLSGEMVGAFLLTEPNVGSDATQIQTLAKQENGTWRLKGQKAWVTNGANADLLHVFAQTQPGSRSKGIASFLVEADSAGVTRGQPYAMLGAHAMGVSDFAFSDCVVDASAQFIQPGEGFKVAMRGIDIARFGVSAMCCGALEAALNVAVSYAKQRQTFGKPIIEHQGLQWQLADLATQLEASRLLTYQTAALFDAGANATIMAAHAKKFATRAALDGLNTAMQALGANGLRREHPLARQLAAVRALHYTDGTTEIQNVVIGRSLVRS